MKPDPGTYALILQSHTVARVQIGRWREIEIRPGYYIYIGSAFGPGGVRARVSRHLHLDKPRRWHIDFLRAIVTPVILWVSYDAEQWEHQWAQALYQMGEMSAIKGFGCGDCKCFSHLFHSQTEPDYTRLSPSLSGVVQQWQF